MKVLILALILPACIRAAAPGSAQSVYGAPPPGQAPPVPPPIAPNCVWNPPVISYPPCSKPCGGGLQIAFRTLTDGTEGAVGESCKFYANKTVFTYTASMKGFVDNASRECNTQPCPEKLACRTCNRTNLAEDGCISSIVDGQQKGECICASGWKGTTCDTRDTEICKNKCKNSGLCQVYAANSTAYCKCIGSWKGADCSEDLCGTNCDKTGTSACYDDGVNGVLCTCKPGYFGQKCNQQSTAPDCSKAPLNNCNKATNQGTCVNNYGMSYCNCSAGFYGKACEQTAQGTNIPTTCKAMQAMECVMSITATKPCDLLSAYLSCADNATCPDLRTLWCQNLPAGAESCAAASCADVVSKANTDWNCNQNLYSTCLAELKKDIHDGAVHGENVRPKVTGYCGASARLARCAANAWCPDLLNMYCRTQTGDQCQDKVNFLPQECKYLPKL